MEVHKTQLIVGLVTLALIAGGVALYRARRSALEAWAWSALLEIEQTSHAGERGQGADPEPYLRVASAHAGTRAGTQALLLAGQALFVQGKFDQARSQFSEFLQRQEDRDFTPTAVFGNSACLDAEGKFSEAISSYQSLITRYPNSAMTSQARLALARLYESQEEPAQAWKVYEDLTRSGIQSAWGAEAMSRKSKLLARHPELAPANAVPVEPPPAMGAATNIISILSSNPASPLSPAP